MLTMETEIWRKTIDTISHLHASWQERRISHEAFKVAVESVSSCLSGVIEASEFRDLMIFANAEVAKAKPEPLVDVHHKDGAMAMVMRLEEHVRLVRSKDFVVAGFAYNMDDEAINMVRKINIALGKQGYKRMKLS